MSNFRLRRFLYRSFLFLGDAVVVWVSLGAAYTTRFHWEPFLRFFPAVKGVPSPEFYLLLQWSALIIWMGIFVVSGFYQRMNLPTLDEFLRLSRGVMMGWVIVLAGTFFYRGVDYSRLVLGLAGVYVFWGLFLLRSTARFLYGRVVVNLAATHTILILGDGRMSKSIRKVLGQHPEFSFIQKSTHSPKELRHFLSSHSVREVYVGEPDLDHGSLIAMSEICDEFDVPFRIVPDVLELRMGEVILDDSLGLPTFQIKPVTLHGLTYIYKRFFDVVFSISVTSVLIFPLLLIALIIKLDSKGPALFGQPRLGHRQKPFHFLKFRTMIQNADHFLEELKKKNNRSGPVFKMKNDPRITRIGKWLRNYSIDEIPQILNVLRGQMSLVGPRPQVLWEAAAYNDWARKRLNVLPGITGLWQVSGRASLSYEEMIELDVYYIEHWSPGLDLKILLRTVPAILGGRGAY